MIRRKTNTAAALVFVGIALMHPQAVLASEPATPVVAMAMSRAVEPAIAGEKPSENGIVAGRIISPVLRKLAQLAWAGAGRALEILFRIRLSWKLGTQVDALQAVAEDLKREVAEQRRMNAVLRERGDAQAKAHSEQLAKGEATLKKMQIALALAPKAAPVPAPSTRSKSRSTGRLRATSGVWRRRRTGRRRCFQHTGCSRRRT